MPDSPKPRPSRVRFAQLMAGVVAAESVGVIARSWSPARIAITLATVAVLWSALHSLLIRGWHLQPRTDRALLYLTVAGQLLVAVGLALSVTWWLPIVPALLAVWVPMRVRPRNDPWPRRTVQVLAAATVIAAGPAFSLADTLIKPSTDPVTLRTVEWLRLRGGAGIVNSVEHYWYSHHAPRIGGSPDVPIAVAAASPSSVPLSSKSSNGDTPTAVRAPEDTLTPVHPLVDSPLPGEGAWTVVSGTQAHPAIAVTRLRPDAVHTSLVVALARMDTSLVRLRLLAGSEDPGGSWANHGKIPLTDRSTLLAAFNSGFRQRESGGGFWIDGRQGAPLVNGAASLVLHKNGTATVGQWGRDASLSPDVEAVRQNLSLIVDNAAPVAGPDEANNRRWGITVGHKVLVWRSGIGVTRSGALIYAGGPGMSIKTLADVLVAAGTVRAMELDINSAWVAYFTYQHTAAGPVGTKLLPGMRHQPTRYLNTQSRDFFALFKR